MAEVECLAAGRSDCLEEQRREPSKEDQQRGAADDAPVYGWGNHCAVAVFAEGVGERSADNEQEEGEDEVGGRPTMPVGMFELPVLIFLAPLARIVDQDHGEDRKAAKDVEREQATAAGQSSGRVG